MTEFNRGEERLNQMGGLWLFNLLPGLGNVLFTPKRCFKKGPMILWLLFALFVIPGFLKYLVLYFTLSIAGTLERLEDENDFAIESEGSARAKNMKPLIRSMSSNKNAGFASGNFEKKMRLMDTRGVPVDIEFYDPLAPGKIEAPISRYGTGERSVTSYEIVTSLSKDDLEKRFDESEQKVDWQPQQKKAERNRINPELLIDTSNNSTKVSENVPRQSVYSYGTGSLPTYANSALDIYADTPLDTFANTKLDTFANTPLDTFANTPLDTMANKPLDTANTTGAASTYKFSADLNKPKAEGTLLDCPQCNEPRNHGFSFCPKCAKMFDF